MRFFNTGGLVDCADNSGADAAHLIIYCRRPGRTWDERIFVRQEQHAGLAITVWGM